MNMKVVSAQQMAHIDSLAYRDGAPQSDFVEESGSGVALIAHGFVETHNKNGPLFIVCGKGNNAADGYVAGIHLLSLDYEVVAFQLFPIAECSSLCRINYQRFLQAGGRVLQINSADELALPEEGLIIDAIFGTGFSGSIAEPYASIIQKVNNSNLPIIAVDIPSGLNGSTGIAATPTIIATETAFLGLPKTGFFLANGWDHVGKLRYVDFGLPQIYIEESDFDFMMLSSSFVRTLLPKMKRSRHKYQAGCVVGIAGSAGMPGAALLSSSAAIHGGAGIVFLLHPRGMEAELASSLPEIIKTPYSFADFSYSSALDRASSVYIGPGMGTGAETASMLFKLLPEISMPCVLDADALTLLAGKEISFPQHTILTPHRGEMNRLLGDDHAPPLSLEYLKRCLTFATEKKVTLVLKGAPTFVIHSGQPIWVNPTGSPGMATAGSGDVLTGLIASLLAQGLSCPDAAALGVYIHGTAGEFAAEDLTPYCMTASDITYRFPEGFQFGEL